MIISFEDDVPFPENNWLAYRKIYVVEQWLRRIALTALMARHGNQFLGALPTEVQDAVKKNIALLRRRAYLGSDDASPPVLDVRLRCRWTGTGAGPVGTLCLSSEGVVPLGLVAPTAHTDTPRGAQQPATEEVKNP